MRTCPHCETELTGAIDAFCPECRGDLSATPEEVRQAAEDGVADARARSAGYALRLTVMAGAGLFASVAAREWDLAILAAVVLVLGAVWVRGEYRDAVVRTTATGNSTTQKDSEEPQ